jgi:hypothetical protein
MTGCRTALAGKEAARLCRVSCSAASARAVAPTRMRHPHRACSQHKRCRHSNLASHLTHAASQTSAELNGCARARGVGCHVRGFDDECRWLNQTAYQGVTGGLRLL